MNVLIACDKFKGSLDSNTVCISIEKGLKSNKNKLYKIIIQPVADGGDGTMEIIKEVLQLETISIKSVDAIGRSIFTNYYTDGTSAFVELADASGIARLDPLELDPLRTTTLGTGQIIKDALSNGVSKIVLGLGGSCTHDVGLGICQVLGFSFFDQHGKELIPSGGNLQDINEIRSSNKQSFQITILCDVQNPLFGPNGAAHTYAAQKGAGPKQIEILDSGAKHIAEVIQRHSGIDISKVKGGGAAGGIAAGLVGLFQAEILSGFDFLSELTDLEYKIKNADWVITGEGKLDASSLQGKVVGQMLALCKKYNKPLIVVAGDTSLDEEEIKNSGIHAIYTVLGKSKDLRDAMANAQGYLARIGAELVMT